MFRHFFLTAIIFVLSGSIFYTTIHNLDPLGEQRTVALFAFFLSMFFGGASFCTFLFFFGAELFSGRKQGSRMFLASLRRGGLIAVFVTSLFLLQFFRFLGIFEATLLAIFLVLVEWICMTTKK
jgi:hypothetical protein